MGREILKDIVRSVLSEYSLHPNPVVLVMACIHNRWKQYSGFPSRLVINKRRDVSIIDGNNIRDFQVDW